MPSSSVVATPGRVPEGYLHAEIASFPLASETAFRSALVALDPTLADGSPTRALWRVCEAQTADHTSWSLDRLVAIRDRTWFDTGSARTGERAAAVSMTTYLRNLARTHFEPAPGLTFVAQPDGDAGPDPEMRRRWLSFALPEDLLLGGLGVEPAPQRVVSDAPLLMRRLLDLGVAEIHQHVGAGMEFSLLWTSALAALATDDVTEDALAGPGASFSGGGLLVRWLLAAAVARCVLGEHLARTASGRGEATLSTYLAALAERRTQPVAARTRQILAALGALAGGDDARLPGFLELRDLYAELHPGARELAHRPLASVEDAYRRCDPLAVRMGLGGRDAGERWWMREGLAYIEERDDPLFTALFWQVVRLRVQYYRAIVERPMTAGLQWFIRFYDRIGKLRAPLAPILVEASFFAAGAGRPIAALEVRTSVGETATKIAEDLLQNLRSWRRVLARASERPTAPEFGVVLHFVKTRDADASRPWARGAPQAFWAGTHAEPIVRADTRTGLRDLRPGRFLAFFCAQAARARAIAELVEAAPEALWLLRGVDIAADELGVPTWVFVPLYQYVRQAADIASLRPQAGPPLGATAHVGEDFRHLLEGLRRIYEQTRYLLGRGGGRLGHAVALGVNPRSWAESAGTVAMPAEERLWDVVFEWRLYTGHRTPAEFTVAPPAGRIERLHNAMSELSDRVLGAVYTPQDLGEAHHGLHSFLAPDDLGPAPAVTGGLDVFARALDRLARADKVYDHRRVATILRSVLEDEQVFRRGQSLIDVPNDDAELAALDAIQAGVRRGVAHRGIVVEVNPSSNLLIGDLADLRNHPILRLFPVEREPGDPPPIAIAVGSDDPVTFSTSLLHEYVLLHQCARAAGYPERSVQAWLESIRRNGMDARMTVAWPTATDGSEMIGAALARFLGEPSPRRAGRAGRAG